MAKVVGLCSLCGARKMLNYARLCKRCNKDPAAKKILEIASEKQHEAQEAALEEAHEIEAEAAEAAAEEAKTEASAEDEKKEDAGQQEEQKKE